MIDKAVEDDLATLGRYLRDHGYSSFADIGHALGWSPAKVHGVAERMRQMGMVYFGRAEAARNIRPGDRDYVLHEGGEDFLFVQVRRSKAINKTAGGRLLSSDGETAEFVVSSHAIDRDNDLVGQDDLWFDEFDANPVCAFVHEGEKIPVGAWMPETRRQEMVTDPGTGEPVLATIMRVRFNRHTQLGQEVSASVADDMLRGASVSFVPETDGEPNDFGGKSYVGQRLRVTEISICPIPSNAASLKVARAICKRYKGEPIAPQAEVGTEPPGPVNPMSFGSPRERVAAAVRHLLHCSNYEGFDDETKGQYLDHAERLAALLDDMPADEKNLGGDDQPISDEDVADALRQHQRKGMTARDVGRMIRALEKLVKLHEAARGDTIQPGELPHSAKDGNGIGPSNVPTQPQVDHDTSKKILAGCNAISAQHAELRRRYGRMYSKD